MQLRGSETGFWEVGFFSQQIAEKLDFEFDFGWRCGSPLR
jgi:hypothetical protein